MQPDQNKILTYLSSGPLEWRATLKDNCIDTLHLQDGTTTPTAQKPGDVKNLHVSIRGAPYDIKFDATDGVTITKPGYKGKPTVVTGLEASRVLDMAKSLVETLAFEFVLAKEIGEAPAKLAIAACKALIQDAYKVVAPLSPNLKSDSATVPHAATPTIGSRAPPVTAHRSPPLRQAAVPAPV
jgi:hypothetical protein